MGPLPQSTIMKFISFMRLRKQKTSDVSAWTWTMLKHRILVLGLVLGFEGQVLGLAV